MTISSIDRLSQLSPAILILAEWGMGRAGEIIFKMADSDEEEQALQKGEKRRQEDSDEDSDDNLSSEENTDASEESFDENMVRV